MSAPIRRGVDLDFLPLGGTGEIGMNLNLYRCGGAWLAVDCGIGFGGSEHPEVDVMMADPAFIAERRERLVGLVITHAHEDHVGGVPYLWPPLRCPVYATPVRRRRAAPQARRGAACSTRCRSRWCSPAAPSSCRRSRCGSSA